MKNRKCFDLKHPNTLRKALGISILSAALCTLTGCMLDPLYVANRTESEADPSSDLIQVGFSQLGSESAWRSANSLSVQNALTSGKGYFLQFDNARQKQENQIKAIRSYISQQVDYIVFSPITEDGWDTVLREARDAGIDVIISDRTVNVSDKDLYTAWVGSDMTEEGRKAGRWLEQDLISEGREDEEINIVVLLGTSRSSAQLGRSEGFGQIQAKHPNWHILAEEDGDFTTAKGREVMEGMLEAFPKIDVVISQNDDMTVGAIEAIEAAGRSCGADGEMRIISFDGCRKALELVQQGKISVDIECNPLQGPYIDEIIQKLENGGEVNKENKVNEKVFTIDNVDAYLGQRAY